MIRIAYCVLRKSHYAIRNTQYSILTTQYAILLSKKWQRYKMLRLISSATILNQLIYLLGWFFFMPWQTLL
jgi:Tfp pilus assembly protein PilN